MTKPLLALACLTVFAVAACKPEPAEPIAATPATVDAPAASGLNPPAVSSDARGFDMKAFAGTFSGTLPCASCPGIDTTLELDAEGTYAIAEVYQDEDGPAIETDGTWTVEASNGQVRLDPNSKSAQDRLFAISSNDQLTQLDLEGQPIDSALDYSLDRQLAN